MRELGINTFKVTFLFDNIKNRKMRYLIREFDALTIHFLGYKMASAPISPYTSLASILRPSIPIGSSSNL